MEPSAAAPNGPRSPGKTGAGQDLVERAFTGTTPNQLWVADFTYVRTWSGFACVAFAVDVFSRTIVGWKADTTMRADLVTDTWNMAAWARGRAGVSDLEGLIHHTDAGSQYTSIAFTERLAALGIRASIGTVGDACGNALAESTIGLFKTELIRRRGPWRTLDDVEIATLERVDWFNNRRLHTELGDIPPAEHEAAYYGTTPSLRRSARHNRAFTEPRGGSGRRCGADPAPSRSAAAWSDAPTTVARIPRSSNPVPASGRARSR